MIWQGKALGALIGVVTAGPVGALFGTFIGHLFDVQAESGLIGRLGGGNGAADADGSTSSIGVQEAFFRATFQVMGHIAKADGRVSENEIRAARAIMASSGSASAKYSSPSSYSSQGKAQAFPLEATLLAASQAAEPPSRRRTHVHPDPIADRAVERQLHARRSPGDGAGGGFVGRVRL